MIKNFCLAWEENKGKLEEYIKTHTQDTYDSYESLVTALFEIVINPYMSSHSLREYNINKMTVIDDGDWQGTLLFVIPENTYTPDATEYIYTYVYYGSCSGCDTLQGIHVYGSDKPNDSQVKEYMTLCLHILQHCSYMVLESEEQ